MLQELGLSAVDLSKYIVTKCAVDDCPISNLQLQKILYYIQKYFLKHDSIAFYDDIEAWQFGPVVPSSYYRFCGFGAMPIDLMVFAGHKTLYGPFGIAGFVSTNEIQLKPLIYGGTGIESANPYMPDKIPIKYEAGSQNIMAIAGLNASLKWILKNGINNLFIQEQKNKETLTKVLKEFDYIRIIEPKTQAIGVISTIIDGYSSDSLGSVFSEHGIAVRTGLQCAPNAHKFLNTFPEGTLRFSVGSLSIEKFILQLTDFLNKLEL